MHYADERVCVRQLDTPKVIIKNEAKRTHRHELRKLAKELRLNGAAATTATSAIFVYAAFEIAERIVTDQTKQPHTHVRYATNKLYSDYRRAHTDTHHATAERENFLLTMNNCN